MKQKEATVRIKKANAILKRSVNNIFPTNLHIMTLTEQIGQGKKS